MKGLRAQDCALSLGYLLICKLNLPQSCAEVACCVSLNLWVSRSVVVDPGLEKEGSKGRGAQSAPEIFKATPTLITDKPTFCARKLASMLAVARMELITVVQVS